MVVGARHEDRSRCVIALFQPTRTISYSFFYNNGYNLEIRTMLIMDITKKVTKSDVIKIERFLDFL